MPKENVLLERPDLHEKKLLILQEVLRSIVSVGNDMGMLANHILELSVNFTNASKGSLMMADEKGEFKILAAKGLDQEFLKSYTVKMGEGIAGTVAKNRQPVLVSDIENDRRFKGKTRDRYKTRSFISCPLIVRNKLLGILNINDKEDGTPFGEEEFTLIRVISEQAAVVIENAMLMYQLKTKASELEEMNTKLIMTEVAKAEFLTRISHELRTPLNSINGAIYFLQKSEKCARGNLKEFTDIISHETRNLIVTVERLLDFVRLEDEAKLGQKSLINISELLTEMKNSKLLKNELAKKNLRLEMTLEDDISDIVGDKIKISQFFLNLIAGLSDYLESNDVIAVSASEDGVVDVVFALSRRMPETVFSYLLDSRKILAPEQTEAVTKLYLARKVAEFHYWNVEMINMENGCIITVKIPKGKRQKTEVVINSTMNMFVEFISDLLDLNTCSIMLSDDLTGELTIKSALGLSDDIVRSTRIKPGDKIAGWVALEGKPLFVENIEADLPFARKNIPQYKTRSFVSLPLKLNDKVIGVINLNNKRNAEPFTSADFLLASFVSERISHFLEKFLSDDFNAYHHKQFMKSFEHLLTVQKRYEKKKSVLPALMAKTMDILDASEEDKKVGLYVSAVYDLGLMLIDDHILGKKRLSTPERRNIKIHPLNTVLLLDGLEFPEDVRRAIMSHHERYDGSGYPDRLKGEEIPFLARVLAVLDSYCAMISERPYRERMSPASALREIRNGSGTLYDPGIVRAFEKALATQL